MPDHSEPLSRTAPFIPSRSRRGRVRNTLGLAVLLAAAGGAYWTYGGHGSGPAPVAAPAAPPAVTVSPPLQRSLAATTEFTGQFSAVDQVDLRAQVSGYLSEIHVADGQLVHKGDLLFVIDPRPYQIALQTAVAQYQTAVASLDLANKQIARSQALKRNDFESAEVVDQRTQVQQAAVASIDQMKAAINSAQLNLEFTRITAPFDGRVGARQVSIGSLVSGAAGSGTRLATIVSLDPVHVDFDMSESDALLYQRYIGDKAQTPNRTVKISLGDEAGWTRTGTLDFLDNQVDRGSGTLHARATVANHDLLIIPGQFARVQVPMSAPRPVLLVPDAAIITDQSRKVLMTAAADGTVTPKPVEIGPLDGNDLRVITKGLAPTDQVVINGLMRLRPGAKVAPHPGTIEAPAAQ